VPELDDTEVEFDYSERTMSIKNILTVIGNEEGVDHLDNALTISQSLEASLTVIVMDMSRPSVVSQYGAANAISTGTTYQHGPKVVEEHAAQVRNQLLALGDERGLVVAAHVLASEVDDVTADYSRLADLTVLPLGDSATSPMFRHVLHGALFRAASPVLLLPKAACAFPALNHAVIGWDSGIQAARALRQSVGILGQAKSVTAVCIDDKPEEHALDQHLVRYMNSHRIEFAFKGQHRERESTGEALLRTGRDLNADLIVMGAYGHSRLREFVVGSTTRHVIENSSVPVLMMH